jgi:hypothetical protein
MGGTTADPAMLNVEFDRSFRATGNAVVAWCNVGCRDSSGQFQDTTVSATCSRAPPKYVFFQNYWGKRCLLTFRC